MREKTLEVPPLAHLIDGFHLELGSHVTDEFNALVASGVEPVIYGEKTGGVTLEDLAENDLLPQQKIDFDGVTYYMSRVFEVKSRRREGEGRPCFVYYLTRTNGGGKTEIYVHAAYKSNSENEWRAISHTTGGRNWFGKGLGELTTGFPLEITDLIEDAYTIQHSVGLGEIKKEFLLSIPKRRAEESKTDSLKPFEHSIVINVPEYGAEKPEKVRDPEQTTTVESRSFPDKIGRFTEADPSSFVFEDGCAPDLDSCFKIKETQNPIYGKVTSYYFFSENLQLQYCFHIDEEGRAWCGAAQVIAPEVTRFGVKNVYLSFGKIYVARGAYGIESLQLNADGSKFPMGLFMPAYEYFDYVAGDFSGGGCSKDYHYCDATKFTHKIPIVAEFRKRAVEGSLGITLKPSDSELASQWSAKSDLNAEDKLAYAAQLLESAPDAQDAEARIKQAQYVLYLAKKDGGISEGLRKRLDYCVRVAGEISANI